MVHCLNDITRVTVLRSHFEVFCLQKKFPGQSTVLRSPARVRAWSIEMQRGIRLASHQHDLKWDALISLTPSSSSITFP
jgi:hypothetical protein